MIFSSWSLFENKNINTNIDKNILLVVLIVLIVVIYIFISFTTSFTIIPYTFVEPFISSKQCALLIGDSILNNTKYTSIHSNVFSFLKQSKQFQCLIQRAQDGATIADVEWIVNASNANTNQRFTKLFLSIGGNDILSNYDAKTQSIDTRFNIGEKIDQYSALVKLIRNKYPNAKIYLCNLYYPPFDTFKPCYSTIQQWNTSLQTIASSISNCVVVPLDKIMVEPTDFVNGIEPSEIGSEKIANMLLNN